MKKLAVLISDTGTGTNLQAIINGCNTKKINAEIICVISDTEKSQGLNRAKRNNLNIEICPSDNLLSQILNKYYPDFVCLAGWKRIVPDSVLKEYKNKILNTHPGLIPDKINGFVKNPDGTKGLWNRGKLAKNAINNFLDNKTTYAGCTNHFLSNQFDFGKVLDRCFEKIKPNDTIDSLYKRLKVKENKMYVNVLRKLCQK
jgi:phosphoribosylglycinamide formyltransferase 1